MNNMVNEMNMSFKCSKELRDRIKYYAESFDMSMGAFIRTAIQAYCGALDRKQFKQEGGKN